MADPGAEMKAAREAELNAREFREHGEWQTTVPFDYAPAGESRWEDRYAAAFAAKEVARAVEEERMACAKEMCGYCDGDNLFGVVVRAAEKDSQGYWWHRTDREDMYSACDAGPIHERSQVKGEG